MYHSFFAEKIGKEHPAMQAFHNEFKEQFLASSFSVRSLIGSYRRERQISFGITQVISSQLRGLSEDQWKDVGNKGTVKEKV